MKQTFISLNAFWIKMDKKNKRYHTVETV